MKHRKLTKDLDSMSKTELIELADLFIDDTVEPVDFSDFWQRFLDRRPTTNQMYDFVEWAVDRRYHINAG